jgi:uncharacterized membrane protein
MGRYIHSLALGCHLLLLGLLFAWVVWFLEPPHWPRPLLILLGILPLALPLRSVLYERPSGYLWTLVLALVYAMHGITELWMGEQKPWLPAAETVLGLGLFLSASFALRQARVREALKLQHTNDQ